ncbi:MAG: glycosyltransferase family 9 protein [Chlorobiaceae bacterium]|nr:glycosyltransferase family 9 protein [Chlorobiaceae bacterium]
MVGVLVVTAAADIRSILIVRLSSIGDIVLTTPVVQELRRAFPGARIDFCTKAPFVQLLAGNPALSSVCTPEGLMGIAYDLVVDLQNNRRSRALLRGLDIGTVRRYHKRNWKKLLLVRFKLNLYGDACRSVVQRYGEALHDLTGAVTAPCAIFLSREDRDFALGTLKGSVPVLAVCFGANHFTKRYPEERFAAVIGQVAAQVPVRIVLLGGKDDIPGGERIMALLPAAVRGRVRSMAGQATLTQSAALLERSDLVLCNDTGLMHLASAFGRKVLVLFGSSVKEFGFLPWGVPFELFEVEGLACRPCSHIGRNSCPKGHFNCMNGIAPERVASRVVEHLRQCSR